MKVVLDSNIYISDFSMNSLTFHVFLNYRNKSNATLLVPEVVLSEVEAKFRKKILKLYSDLKAANSKIKRLTQSIHIDSKSENVVDIETIEFSRKFRSKLKNTSAEILGYPSVDHEDIVDRAIKKLKPFKKEDSGYRDYLIWCSILESLLASDEKHIFISQNTTDFFQNGDIHPDFILDLDALDIPRERVEFYNSLNTFNEKYILPKFELSDKLKLKIERDEFNEFDFNEWISDNILNDFDSDEIKDMLIQLPLDCGYSEAFVISVKKIKINDVLIVKDRIVYFKIFTIIHLFLSVDVGHEDIDRYPEAEYYISRDEIDYFDGGTIDYEEDVDVEFSIIIDMKDWSVLSSEIGAFGNWEFS